MTCDNARIKFPTTSLFFSSIKKDRRRGVIKGFVIAGTQSGCGKTTISLGLMAALIRRGLKVAPFKVGPDFIDPGHHAEMTGMPGRNLDGWMLAGRYNRDCFKKHTLKIDVAVIEGVMGLFDGYDGKSEAGSTAQMAKWLNLPVVLVVNAKSMARSAAALVSGFEQFDKGLAFAGVVFNSIGSKRHLEFITEALDGNIKMPCLGGIPYSNDITLPERHLGLVTSLDNPLSNEYINKLADIIEENMDLNALLDSLSGVDMPEELRQTPVRPPGLPVRIGVAMDNAFCFYYQDNLEMLENYGAQLIYFSPVTDDNLPKNLDGIYFGGGYPELFAKQLSDNLNMRGRIKEVSGKGMPVYGECGGFMYLCNAICDSKGNPYPMTGCFPFVANMFPRLKSLGYREITLAHNTLTGERGNTVRGHEFRYSDIAKPKDQKEIKTVYNVAAKAKTNKTDEGYLINNTLGSYIHLHFGSNPDTAACFVESCRNYKLKFH